MKRFLSSLMILFVYSVSFTQIISKDTTDLTFTGTKLNQYTQEYDSTGKIIVSGYIDTYYSSYSDTVGPGGYAKFPTASPKNNQFGLNIIQVSAKYNSDRMRGTATLFYGDIPLSAWSTYLNLIQEANAGFRIYKKLWIDAGYFRTHLGLESIQPRENSTCSVAMSTYYGPYFLSGAKLTWQQSDQWTYQVNVFNGFSTFLESNKNKAVGISVAYAGKRKKWSHTLNSVLCDEYPTNSPQRHLRSYTNYIGVYKTTKWVLGLEGNFGIQENSKLNDSTASSTMFSGIVAAKYRFTHQLAAYSRFEFFSDPDEMLTGPIENQDHTLVGLDAIGGTIGFEFKPIPNAFFRLESRILETKKPENIFFYKNESRNTRMEGIASIGLWF